MIIINKLDADNLDFPGLLGRSRTSSAPSGTTLNVPI